MSENSKIEWTDHTFNIRWGCVKVSEGCEHCYAEQWDKRYGGDHWGPNKPRRIMSDKYWNEPLKWNRAAEKLGLTKRVFCSSMADVFEDVNDGQLNRLWELIRKTPNLDWLLLTKRPENIARMLPDDWGTGYSNVWLGTTAENQRRADERIPSLLNVPAKIHFLSCEPLLGPIDLQMVQLPSEYNITPSVPGYVNALEKNDEDRYYSAPHTIDWVIVGGESGPGARPMLPDWARQIRNQCDIAGVAFFFKQWGEHDYDRNKVGKTAAGRILDTRTHEEYPVCT